MQEKRIEEHSQQSTLLPLAEQHEGGNGIPPTNKLVGILPKRLWTYVIIEKQQK